MQILRLPDRMIDLRSGEVSGQRRLERHELRLLHVLVATPNVAVPTDRLVQRVWGSRVRSGTVSAAVDTLRAVLEVEPTVPRVIVAGEAGVRFVPRPPFVEPEASPFVGREAELRWLDAVRGTVAVLWGAGGIGKTRLAERWQERRVVDGAFGCALSIPADGGPLVTRLALAAGVDVAGTDLHTALGRVERTLTGGPTALRIDDADRLSAEDLALLVRWAKATDLRIVLTARRPLDLPSAAVLEVGPLDGPDLAGVLERAWDTLDPPLQAALVQLAVFEGGVAAADGVVLVGAGRVEELRRRSLIHRIDTHRFVVHGLVRDFVWDRAPAGVVSAARAAHRDHFRARLAEARPLDGERDNLRVIADDVDTLDALAGRWIGSTPIDEVLALCDRGLGLANGPEDEGRLRRRRAEALRRCGRLDEALDDVTRAVVLLSSVDDPRVVLPVWIEWARTRLRLGRDVGEVTHALGGLARYRPEVSARSFAEVSILTAEAQVDAGFPQAALDTLVGAEEVFVVSDQTRGPALAALGHALRWLDRSAAEQALRSAILLARGPEDRSSWSIRLAEVLVLLGRLDDADEVARGLPEPEVHPIEAAMLAAWIATLRGDPTAGEACARAVRVATRGRDDRYVALGSATLGMVALERGEWGEAERRFADAGRRWSDAGSFLAPRARAWEVAAQILGGRRGAGERLPGLDPSLPAARFARWLDAPDGAPSLTPRADDIVPDRLASRFANRWRSALVHTATS